MWKLDKPTVTAKSSFEKSISRMRTGDLKTRLSAIGSHIELGSQKYETDAKAGTLHYYPRLATVANVTAHEMADVYDQRFAAKKGPARFIYDQIISAPENACCPLCGHRDVTTLDHHLPKLEYPILAVSPLNLVPACMECNKIKKEKYPVTVDAQTLHPYFDDVTSEQWLRARVEQTRPTSLFFFVSKPDGWTDLLFVRVQNHFKEFELNKLYAAQAATELTSVRKRAEVLFQLGGAINVQTHFTQEAISRRSAALNSWRTAVYEAIAQSQWYCSGNF